ncbi:hypothetical protein DV515_00004949 [Chloebia gouldiae]|uniref:UDP-N-acetylglucosamine transferase subunit ALG14 n=1 Tax=Chloebia gouldiae TaxID=44316 RepID=A0A3L8SPY6_CHLGU|nr:hypothetical protein DV515_00004949 [Chloebia gouldiae]
MEELPVVVLLLLLLSLLLVPLVLLNRRRRGRRTPPFSLLVVAGSGGHTTEILRLLSCLSESYSPRHYVLADSDKMSEAKIRSFEQKRAETFSESQTFRILNVHRAYLLNTESSFKGVRFACARLRRSGAAAAVPAGKRREGGGAGAAAARQVPPSPAAAASGQPARGRALLWASLERIPRSREVRQSWVSSVVTTLYSILYSLPLTYKRKPDLVGN